MTKLADLRACTPGYVRSRLPEIALLGFLVIYSAFLFSGIDEFTPVSDEAMHCLGGVVCYDFVRDFLRDPWILLGLKQWVADYTQKYEIGMSVAFYGIFFHAVQMLMYHVFGISVSVARTTIVIFSLLNLVVVYVLGRKISSSNVGLLAAMLLGCHPFYFFLSRHVMLDVPVNFTTNLAMLFLLLFHKKESNRYLLLTGLFLGLSFITHVRSLVYAPVMFVSYVIWNDGVKVVKSRTFWIPIVLSFSIFSLWFIPSVITSSSLGRLYYFIGRHGAIGSRSWADMLLMFFHNIFTLFWRRSSYAYFLGDIDNLYNYFMSSFYIAGILYTVFLSHQRKDESSKLIATWFFSVYLSLAGFYAFFSSPQAAIGNFERYQCALFPSLAIAMSNLVFTMISYANSKIENHRVSIAFRSSSLIGILLLLLLGAQQGVFIYHNWGNYNARIPYGEAVDFILVDSNGEITVLVDRWAPSFYIIVHDSQRRVTIKTLQHLGLSDVEEYIRALDYPDYIMISTDTYLRHQGSFSFYSVARSYKSSGPSTSDVLVLRFPVESRSIA